MTEPDSLLMQIAVKLGKLHMDWLPLRFDAGPSWSWLLGRGVPCAANDENYFK